jgi:hypothetical protein
MTNMTFSRRRFLALAGATAVGHRSLDAAGAAPFSRGQNELTVQDVVTLVQKSVGGAPAATTVDGLKAGRLDQRVTGITTTAMATSEVIRLASARKHNLVISFEPTFFARADQASPANRASDAVFADKRGLLDERGVAVWRLRDQWLARRPDPLVQGLAEALGWQQYQASAEPHRVVLPALSLRDLATHVRTRLGARALRIVGDPGMRVTRVVLSPGASAPATTFTNLATADVILAGEPREWEGVEYVQDAIAAGQAKAMIIVGRVLSEDPAMKVMAQWLAGLVPGVPVEWTAVGDRYWRPSGS